MSFKLNRIVKSWRSSDLYYYHTSFKAWRLLLSGLQNLGIAMFTFLYLAVMAPFSYLFNLLIAPFCKSIDNLEE